MNILNEYQIIKKIYFDSNYHIYRAIHQFEKTSVIIKIVNSELPESRAIAWLKNEQRILQNLNLTGILKPYSLKQHQNSFALVFEDFEGEYLDRFLKITNLSQQDFFTIALQLVKIIHQLHQNQIIHKYLQPSSIVIHPETLEVKITNFRIATNVVREQIFSRELETSNIAYISPEQTGRMNIPLDYRTDFYSLGVIFYQLLTGALPHNAQDLLGLIHGHLAYTPVVPHQLNPDISTTVSSIVMKLLAKNPEDRYQSADSIKVDLEICQTQYLEQGKIEPFNLGILDKRSQFLISPKLYGRLSAMNSLRSSLEKVYAGSTEIIVVSGASGMGKTSVIYEATHPIVTQKGYLITGKFEEFKDSIPYSGIIQAFGNLVQQLLTETSDNLQLWKEKILSAIGTNGRVITDIIPELALIIGSQPEIPQLLAKETQNRFNNVFEKFIGVFLDHEHPVTLFLDNLQWADSASLQLLELLFSNFNSQYLLVIGSYRDNEVNSTHRLVKTIEKIEQTIVVSKIVLEPLTIEDINQLLVDTLNCLETKSLSLARLLLERTNGNPFFINQLLQTFYKEKLINFDVNSLSWKWQIEEIQVALISNYNIVKLITSNLEKLPATSQQLIKLAACLGNRFDLVNLAIVSNQTQDEIIKQLSYAVQAGMITLQEKQLNISYKFLHDRIQQAAYALLNEAEKIEIHFKIGQFLLQQTNPEELEEKIFNLVHHLNIARKIISDKSLQNHLAQLNLIAGSKAKATTAYELAANYLDVAREVLPPSTWKDNYDLTLNIYLNSLKVQYLLTNFDRAKQLGELILTQAETILDRVEVYKIKIHSYIAQNQMQLAIDIGRDILQLLHVSLVENPPETDEIVTYLNLDQDSVESFKTLPEMTDANTLAAMEILTTIMPPAYIVKPQLFSFLVLKAIKLCQQYGNAPISAFVYAVYGLLLCAGGNIDTGYQMGKLALAIQEKFNVKQIKPKVSFIFNNMILHWRESAFLSLDNFLEGIQDGIEVGDIEHACFHAKYYCTYLFLLGEHLASAKEQYNNQIIIIQNFKQNFQLNYARIWEQLNLNLQGLVANKLLLISENFDESKMLDFWLQTNNATSLFGLYLAKLILCYLLKNHPQAIFNARQGKQYLQASIGTMCFSAYHFYACLAMLAVYKSDIESTSWQEILFYQKQLKQWANSAPDNYLHKYQLVSAEIARVSEEYEKATEYYDKAITAAEQAGYMHEAALAKELTGEFYLFQGKTKIAGYYLTDAYYGYCHWGALAKVQDLESRYSDLLNRNYLPKFTTTDIQDIEIYEQSVSLAKLDLYSIIKASQAISSEIILDNLLCKMMEIVMENAGAQKAILLLQQNSSWLVAASATITPKQKVDLLYIPIAEYIDLPNSIFNYIQRTRNTVLLDRASSEGIFVNDSYIVKYQPESILSCPMIYQNELQGIIYLENSVVRGAFTAQKLDILQVLLSQVSISLENARLYKNLENHASVKKSLKEKEILLKEIHHRVKNNLFVVSSILEFQSRFIDNSEVIQILENCQNRIKSMALVHQHLYGNSKLNRINFAQYIKSLLDHLAYSQNSAARNINFFFDLEPIELNVETANPCGLIINELVSNSLEHGFCDRESGNIWLSLKHNLEGKIVLIIQDNGVGFGEDRDLYNSDSLGLELVCTLVEQLHGAIALDKTNGTKIEITFQELDYQSRI